MQAEAQLIPLMPLRHPPEDPFCHLPRIICEDAHRCSVQLMQTIDKEGQVEAEIAMICTA